MCDLIKTIEEDDEVSECSEKSISDEEVRVYLICV